MKKIVKIELANPRFSKAEIKGHASEFILYARYSGFILDSFNEHLSNAKLIPVRSDFNETFKLHIETTVDNAKVLYQLTKLYPSFGNWKVRSLTSGVDITTFTYKTAKPSARKKTAKKKSAKTTRPAKASANKKKHSAAKPVKKKTATSRK